MKERIVKILIFILFLSTLKFSVEGNILSITILNTWRLYVATFLAGFLFSLKRGIRIGEELVKEEKIDASTERTNLTTRREKRRERARRRRVKKE